MSHDSEYTLTNAAPPPWWVRRNGFLRKLWANPVFQRNYARSRVRRLIEPKRAFWFAFGFSASVNLALLLTYDSELALPAGFGFLQGLMAIIFLIVYIRMFIACLIWTSRELQSDMGGDKANFVLSTPLTDSEIYYAEVLPNFVRGLEIIESFLYMLAGVTTAFILTIALSAAWLDQSTGYLSLLTIGGFVGDIWALLSLVLMMLLVSFASGLYSLSLPMTGAVIAALIHYAVISGFLRTVWWVFCLFTVTPGWCGLWIYGYAMPLINPIFLIINFGFIVLACFVTARLGISAFTRARRSGYYKPLHSTAAGLPRR